MDKRLGKKRKYGNKPREDKSTLTVPKCPFCGQPFKRPEVIRGEFTDFTGGSCDCGAAYVCDETGKNLGDTFMDCLVFACKGDWDKALSLSPDEDYSQHIMDYNSASHSVSVRFGARSRGKIVFVKLK